MMGVEMYSSHISRVEKARNYAEERDRVTINVLSATFRGNNNTHQLTYEDGQWNCTCRSFSTQGSCSHAMALQEMLEEVFPSGAPEPA